MLGVCTDCLPLPNFYFFPICRSRTVWGQQCGCEFEFRTFGGSLGFCTVRRAKFCPHPANEGMQVRLREWLGTFLKPWLCSETCCVFTTLVSNVPSAEMVALNRLTGGLDSLVYREKMAEILAEKMWHIGNFLSLDLHTAF